MNGGEATVRDPTTDSGETAVNEIVITACARVTLHCIGALPSREVLRCGFAASQDDIGVLRHEILRRRVMHHNRRRTLLGLEQES